MTATETALDRCVACHGRSFKPRFAGVLECTDCGHVFADLDCTEADLHALYQDGYFNGDEYSDYAAEKHTLQKNFRLRWKVLASLLDENRHRRLFEVGCAHGYFLEVVRDRFSTVTGIDVSAHALSHARELGFDVIEGNLLDTDLGDQRFDVACMWDCIEHLKSPDLHVEKLAAHMDEGAMIAITTGDIGSLNARMRGKKWRLMHPPTHVHYFSKATLTKMLERYGFEIRYLKHCGFHRSLENAVHGVLGLERGSRAHRAVQRSVLSRLSFYLNLYDIMYVIGEKRA